MKMRVVKKRISSNKKSKRSTKEKSMRPVPMIRIFGYGSLLNQKTVDERLPGNKIIRRAILQGYQRTFRKKGIGHVYLTLSANPQYAVVGTLLDLAPPDFVKLTHSEYGYDLVDVTDQISDYGSDEPPVYCYIAVPLETIPENIRSIRGSYIQKCLGGVPEDERAKWLEETDIPDGVTVAEDK